MRLGMVSLTWKHGMRGVAYQQQTFTMPNREWWAIEQFPELDVCGFSVRLLVILVAV